ncbi:MAG: hypothetical protein M1594_00105 [Candidatus Marsarchaeota archaeon]|nr:hypothetical protein [Candidatus Marsarchaeota archaeon]
MDEIEKNKNAGGGGVSKNTLYLIGAVVLVLGLFLAFNVNAALTQNSKPAVTQSSQQSSANSYGSQQNGVQPSAGAIPSQVGGCS